MEDLSIFNQVFGTLEQHENSTRIKKLMFSACKKHWENDVSIINQIGLDNLLQELRQSNLTLDDFKSSLYAVVKTLNKQADYSLVANIILGEVAKLYLDEEESTQLISTPAPSSASVTSTSDVPYQEKSYQANDWSSIYDPFKLRLEIMKYTNPLRAKILLFSTLKHKFDMTDQDWLLLKTHELDALLQNLFRSCKTIQDVENQLYKTAKSLQEPEENTQAANAIVQAMKPLYGSKKIEINVFEPMKAVESNRDKHNQVMPSSEQDDDENTCQFFPPNK